tara:strand:+ start:174 stop:902 length:729 start_codon:yes stop_codon:yes gene_type:complete
MNVVIFGATGGIGKCLSAELAKDNNLFLGSRNKDKIENLLSLIDTQSLCSGIELDATKFESVKYFLEKAANFLGSIDCIINCTGSLLLKPAHLTNEDELENVFKTNVYSSFSIIKYGFKYLRKNGGSMIFFSSAAAMVGLKNHEAIAAAKGAISSMVLSSASTYSKYNIRLNAIAPGLVQTPLTDKITSNKISLEYSKSIHGLNRIGKPENFIPIIKSLIDKRSDWITGQTIAIDGGLSNVK